MTRLSLVLSHLQFHEFKHSIEDTVNPICNCGSVETLFTIFFIVHNFSNGRLTLFKKLQSIDENIVSKDDSSISKVLFLGDRPFNDCKKYLTVYSIEYIISAKRFDVPLYQD